MSDFRPGVLAGKLSLASSSPDILTPFPPFFCFLHTIKKTVTRARAKKAFYERLTDFHTKNNKASTSVRQSDPKIKNKINSQNRIDECLKLLFSRATTLLFLLLPSSGIVPSLARQRRQPTIRHKSDANNSKRRMSIDSPSLSHSKSCWCVHRRLLSGVVVDVILGECFSCAWLLMTQKNNPMGVNLHTLGFYLLAWGFSDKAHAHIQRKSPQITKNIFLLSMRLRNISTFDLIMNLKSNKKKQK